MKTFQKQLVVNLLGMTDCSILHENLRQRLAEQIGVKADGLESLGLLDDTQIVKCGTPLDTLSYYLSKRLAFGKFLSCCLKKIYYFNF